MGVKLKSIYLIGSLRNENIPIIGNSLRDIGFDVFDDWFSPGPHADDYWRDYEKSRGNNYLEGLKGYAAKHIFEFDLFHINRCDMAVLTYPSGKSAHLELGYMIGQGKPGYILLDDPERWDVMLQFAAGIFTNLEDLKKELQKMRWATSSSKS